MNGFQTDLGFKRRKEKKLAGKGRVESGQVSGRIALRKMEIRPLLSGQYPARNLTGNPARLQPGSNVSGTVHVGFDFHFF